MPFGLLPKDLSAHDTQCIQSLVRNTLGVCLFIEHKRLRVK